MRKLTQEEAVSKFIMLHGNRYDYHKFIYVNNSTKGIIICHIHGDFEQNAANHFNGEGCPRCVPNFALEQSTFVEKANKKHNNRYRYDKFIYVNSITKGIITCPDHGDFEQIPASHLIGKGCFDCSSFKKTSNKIEFVKKANLRHGNRYNYDEFIYVNSRTKGTIICLNHGRFQKSPNRHLNGRGCPHCHIGKNEQLILSLFIENQIIFEFQKKIRDFDSAFPNYIIDYYLPTINLFLELNGRQHYEPASFGESSIEKTTIKFEQQIKRDANLEKICETLNINLIWIDGRKYHNHKLITYIKENILPLVLKTS